MDVIYEEDGDHLRVVTVVKVTKPIVRRGRR